MHRCYTPVRNQHLFSSRPPPPPTRRQKTTKGACSVVEESGECGLFALEIRENALHGVEQRADPLVPGAADDRVRRLDLAGERRQVHLGLVGGLALAVLCVMGGREGGREGESNTK